MASDIDDLGVVAFGEALLLLLPTGTSVATGVEPTLLVANKTRATAKNIATWKSERRMGGSLKRRSDHISLIIMDQ